MTPYHEENGVAIYHGDALEVLAALELENVDAFVTDPPYCSGAFQEAGRKAVKGQGLRRELIRDRYGWFGGDNMGTAGLVFLLRAIAVEAAASLVPGGSLCLFTDWRQVVNVAPAMESSGLRWQNLVVWDKGSAGLGSGFRARHELVLHFVKGTGRFYSSSHGNVLTVGRMVAADRLHQTEKPEELLAPVLEVVTPPGGLVVDPFAGSGTTGAAAIRQGRRAVLVEIEERNCEVAARRIGQAGVFTAPAPEPVQEGLAL